MPLPTPNTNEEKQAFISRCMSELNDEFPNPSQRLAVCRGIFEKKKSAKLADDLGEL